MANIATEIKNFLSAIYGKDVRASLVSMAEKLNYEVENNTTVAKNAANSANEAASNANEAAANANEATERANTAASEAEDAAINANEAAERVKDTPVAKIEEEVAQVKSDFNKHTHTASDVGAVPSNKVNFVGDGKEINIGNDDTKTYIKIMSEGNVDALQLEYNKSADQFIINKKRDGVWSNGYPLALLKDLSSMDLLWQNYGVTSDFPTQTLSINMAPYKFLLLDMIPYKSWGDNVFTFTCICRKGYNGELSYARGNHQEVYYRDMSIPDLNSVWFGDGQTNGTVNNGCLVPYRIYGVK